jgi:hypothetical protein
MSEQAQPVGRLMFALANVFMFFALMPFISPLPTVSDVQFPAFVVAALIIGWDLLQRRIRFDWVDWLFLVTAVWSFCYVLPSGEFVLRQRAGLLMAFGIYYVVKRHSHLFAPQTVYAALVVGFVATVIQWLRPDVFMLFAPRIIRTVKGIDAVRGVAGLSAEPSFLSAMALVQGLLLCHYYRIGRTTGPMLTFGCALSFGMILMSRSATGFVTLLIVFAIWLVYFTLTGLRLSMWMGGTALIVAAIVLMTGPMAKTRGGLILVALYKHPSRVLTDGSLQERVVNLFLGGAVFLHHPLGVGGGGYSPAALEMATLYHADRIFKYAREETFGAVLSSLGLYLAELGVVFLLFLVVIFWRSLRPDPFHLAFCVVALIFIAGTFSITCPLTWILLGMTGRRGGLREQPGPSQA